MDKRPALGQIAEIASKSVQCSEAKCLALLYFYLNRLHIQLIMPNFASETKNMAYGILRQQTKEKGWAIR